jgi:L-lysine exporter family protein LysE/ArgO
MTNLIPTFLSGLALSAALIMAIGAQNMFVLRQGLRREHVGPVVLFCGTADALLISAGVAGLGVFLTMIPNLSLILTIGGAGFLGWYGVSALRHAARPAAMVVTDSRPISLAGALASTAAFTFLNPRVYLDTVLLMGTVGASQPLPTRPLFIAGAATASFTWFGTIGYGARLLTPVFARPNAWKVLDCLIGMAMLALATSLLMLIQP